MSFFRKCPALLGGGFSLLGGAFALTKDPCFLFPLALLEVAAFVTFRSRALWFHLFLLASFFLTERAKPPPLAEREIRAQIEITEKKRAVSPFGKRLSCRGNLLSIDGVPLKQSINCSFSLPVESSLNASFIYEVAARIVQKNELRTVLKIARKAVWEKKKSSSPLPEWRFVAKGALEEYLSKKIPSRRARILLSALLTGEIEEIGLSYQFGKVGLQHLLAISGFHFALIALLFHTVLSFLLPKRASYLILLIPLTLYFLFLGPSPSILRSYIGISFYLIGRASKLPLSPFNALGLALLFELLLDPLAITQAGFQLSFFATLSLLLLYSPSEKLLRGVFRPRSFKQLLKASSLEQHLYPLRNFLHKSLALNLSVFLLTAPLLLAWFHKIPLISLFYNLFIPLLTSISLGTTLVALLPIPFLSPALFWLISAFTDLWLRSFAHPPAILHFVIRVEELPLQMSVPLISCLLVLAFLFSSLTKNPSEDQNLGLVAKLASEPKSSNSGPNGVL